MNSLLKTIFHIDSNLYLWEKWTMYLQSVLPNVSDKRSFQDHLPSKTMVLTWWVLCFRRPKQWMHIAESSPVSLMNVFLKTIPLLKLLYQLKVLSPRRPQQWMCSFSPSVSDKQPFQDHLLYQPKETWNMNMHSFFPSVTDKWPFKTIFQVQLSYWPEELYPRRPEQWRCR